jgi:hypothetical protein
MTIDEFWRQLDGSPAPDTAPKNTLYLTGNEMPEPVIDSLADWFSNTEEKSVVLRLADRPPRLLVRETFLKMISPVNKGAPGDGDFATLPGLSELSALRFHCPVDGAIYFYFLYDESNPVKCQAHPDVVLEFVR